METSTIWCNGVVIQLNGTSVRNENDPVQIIRIKNMHDVQVTSGRVVANDDEAQAIAAQWTESLLRANPGLILKWTVNRASYTERGIS